MQGRRMQMLAPGLDPAPSGPSLEPHPSLIIASSFDDTALRRACLRGDLERLVAGRYIRREHWEGFDSTARHVMFALAAVSCLETPVVVSHVTAAAFWGLPRLGPWPVRAHVLDPRLATGTTGRYVQRHVGDLDATDIVQRHGVAVTSPLRTVTDIALGNPFRQSVVALDHCYRVGFVTAEEVRLALSRRQGARGIVRARRAVDFADGRANRPGESLSRVVMAEARVSPPELQFPFVGPRSRTAEVDFFWRNVGIVGEFDGETKYRDSERWSGLAPEEVVIREKNRENWIRALAEVRGFVRWTWRDALAPGRLARILNDAGVPSQR